ncbi:MAG TPA: hypothetical protein VNT01_08865 [Symbiobacteriaceae bacterium]|nr:hypothetical protein [Symbiobacteriaceae bacterium]
MAPAPVAAAPVAPAVPAGQVAAAVAAPAPAATGTYKLATTGDLLNNGSPVAILVTEDRLTLLPAGGAPIAEQIPGIRHAIAGDFDGDGTQELAVFSDTQVWVLRFSAHGSVPSGKVTLKEMPEFLARAPFTHDGGRTVLMSASTEKIVFYVLHPSKGLVEIASTPVPFIEP